MRLTSNRSLAHRLLLAAGLALAWLSFASQYLLARDDERSTPQSAVEALKKALEENDFKSLSQIVPGPYDAILRKMAEPMGKAQAAQGRLEAALKDQPNIQFVNPFGPALNPFTGISIELVEVGKEGARNIVRIRYGRKGTPLQEEVLGLVSEGNSWRIGLPAELAKELRRLTNPPEELDKQVQRLDGLAKVLTTLAGEVEKKQLQTREGVVLRLAQLVAEAKLADEPKKEVKK